MTLHRMLASACALLLAAVVGCADQPATDATETAQPEAAAATSAPDAAAPAAEPAAPGVEAAEARPQLIAPVRGEAELGYLRPVSRRKGGMVITTITVKNLSKGAIAGLKVDEFWYDKAGEPVTGAQSFRWRKPLQPGEVIDVVLEVPTNPNMNSNTYKFEHANGTIKTTLLASIE